MSLEEKIKRWVNLDNNYKKYNEQIKKIRIEKNNICDELIEYFNEKNVKFPNIKITDGKLSLSETNITNPITLQFLKNCFKQYFEDDEVCDDLLNFIKSKRVYNKNKYIKRFYNKIEDNNED